MSSAAPTQASFAGSPELLERRRVIAYRLFYSAGGLFALSISLPWVAFFGLALYPYGEYLVPMLVVAALYAGEGYLVHQRRVTNAITIAVWLLDVLVAVGVVLIFKGLGGFGAQSGGEQVAGPAAGVFVAGIGVVAGVAATIQLHRSGAPVPNVFTNLAPTIQGYGSDAQAAQRKPFADDRTARDSAPPPPGAEISPDGLYWWDEARGTWRPIPEAGPRATPVEQCPNGHAVEASDEFCGECGTPLAQVQPTS